MSKLKTWKEVKKDFNLTEEEKMEIDLEVQLIETAIEARKKAKLTQRDLSGMSGVKQPSIAKIESLTHSPQASTLIKLLYPMGYTLQIVPLKYSDKRKNKNIKKEKVM